MEACHEHALSYEGGPPPLQILRLLHPLASNTVSVSKKDIAERNTHRHYCTKGTPQTLLDFNEFQFTFGGLGL